MQKEAALADYHRIDRRKPPDWRQASRKCHGRQCPKRSATLKIGRRGGFFRSGTDSLCTVCASGPSHGHGTSFRRVSVPVSLNMPSYSTM